MDLSIWNECLQSLRNLLPQQQFNKWIMPLEFEQIGDGVVVIAPNQYVLEYISEKYLPLMESIMSTLQNTVSLKVSIIVKNKKEDNSDSPVFFINDGDDDFFSEDETNLKENYDFPQFYEEKARKVETISISENNRYEKKNNNLNPVFSLKNFVEGKSNQLAKAAAFQVVENPGVSYNPLFLYGGVGLGKTHLIQAVGNALNEKGYKILYIHAEKFVADMVLSLQTNTISEFKEYYRSIDVLLLDDVQFFAGKERSQEEFFHTFNFLLEEKKQIIVTADRYPKEILGLEERLKSRFGSGLTVIVEPPELETRVAILMSKSSELNIRISPDIAFLIAKRVRSNVRELEGALKRVIANAQFTGKNINSEFVKEVLRDLFDYHDKMVSQDNIVRTVAEYYKVNVTDLISHQRSRIFARPRQVAMCLCKELTNLSLSEIGDLFGGRDHTTVLYACKQIQKLKSRDSEMSEDYDNLMRTLTS